MALNDAEVQAYKQDSGPVGLCRRLIGPLVVSLLGALACEIGVEWADKPDSSWYGGVEERWRIGGGFGGYVADRGRLRSGLQGGRGCLSASQLLTETGPAAARTRARPDPAAVEDRWRFGGGRPEVRQTWRWRIGGGQRCVRGQDGRLGQARGCPRQADLRTRAVASTRVGQGAALRLAHHLARSCA
jgi:hypothetical protein